MVLNDETKYRGYFFALMQLSPIQAGIQAAHCVSEMTLEYNYIFDEWAQSHKTIILLNGGNHQDLNQLYDELKIITKTLIYKIGGANNHLPVVKFTEDEQSLNNATTCVGIIIPNRVYDIPNVYCEERVVNVIDVEMQLKQIISQYHLAR